MRFDDIKKLDSGIGGVFADYQFLYAIIAMLRPTKIIEIGTNTGVSSIVMALSLQENDINGHIYTYDISPGYRDIALKQIEELNLNSHISSYLENSSEIINQKYDLGFIDGDHTYEGVKKDFLLLKDKCDYLIFHDARSCEGVRQFLNDFKDENFFVIDERPNNPVYNKSELVRYAGFPGIALWRRK